MACLILTDGFMDLIDGVLARKLNQISQLGGALDMVIDRVSINAFLVFFGTRDPDRWLLYAFMSHVDIASPLIQVFVAFKRKVHHKQIKNHFKVCDWYYNVPGLLFVAVFLSEGWVVCHYLYIYQLEVVSPDSNWVLFSNFCEFFIFVPGITFKMVRNINILIQDLGADHECDPVRGFRDEIGRRRSQRSGFSKEELGLI